MPFSFFLLNLLRLNIRASDEDLLNQHLLRGICILHQPGLAVLRKEATVIEIFTARFLGPPHGDILPIYCPKSVGDIPSISELFLDLFSVFRSGNSGQALFLKFSKDKEAGNRDEFTNGSLANQPAIL